jgi:transcriptional regulator with XRE-family HTH domain
MAGENGVRAAPGARSRPVSKSRRERHASTEPVRFLGREIRGLRRARGCTLAELAKATHLSVGYLSLLERDLATPSINALQAISRAFGVTISWFSKLERRLKPSAISWCAACDAGSTGRDCRRASQSFNRQFARASPCRCSRCFFGENHTHAGEKPASPATGASRSGSTATGFCSRQATASASRAPGRTATAIPVPTRRK